MIQWRGIIEEYRKFLPVTEATPVVSLNEALSSGIDAVIISSDRLEDRLGANAESAVQAAELPTRVIRLYGSERDTIASHSDELSNA